MWCTVIFGTGFSTQKATALTTEGNHRKQPQKAAPENNLKREDSANKSKVGFASLQHVSTQEEYTMCTVTLTQQET